MNVIPAIDLRGGRCVRLFKGDFERETSYGSDIDVIAAAHASSGAEWLHVVDLDGARDGVQVNQSVVRRLAANVPMKLQLGGGLRQRSDVESWLNAGIRRCVVGSVAVREPDEVATWLRDFGAESLVLALDVRIDEDGRAAVVTHGWRDTTSLSIDDAIDAYAGAGLRHLLCTDVSRDGAMTGPNVDLYRELQVRYPALELQASGGVRDLADLELLRSAGVAAAITGRALLDGRLRHEEIRTFLQSA